MRDLVDRGRVMNDLFEAHPIGFNGDDIAEAFKNATAVDAVEVVRCKDCKAFGKSPWGHFPKGWCKIHGRHRDPEYYCASGVRKDEEVET